MPVFDFRLGASLLSIINLSFLVCSALQSVPVPKKQLLTFEKKSLKNVRQNAKVKFVDECCALTRFLVNI